MFPEEVYALSLPLPYELLRPISFQVAYNLINEKLRFPKRGEGFLGAFLRIVNNEEKSVFFHWYEGDTGVFTTQLIHRVYPDDTTHERKYYSAMTNTGYRNWVIFCIPTDMLIKFLS